MIKGGKKARGSENFQGSIAADGERFGVNFLKVITPYLPGLFSNNPTTQEEPV
jgi:hypothetical protein